MYSSISQLAPFDQTEGVRNSYREAVNTKMDRKHLQALKKLFDYTLESRSSNAPSSNDPTVKVMASIAVYFVYYGKYGSESSYMEVVYEESLEMLQEAKQALEEYQKKIEEVASFVREAEQVKLPGCLERRRETRKSFKEEINQHTRSLEEEAHLWFSRKEYCQHFVSGKFRPILQLLDCLLRTLFWVGVSKVVLYIVEKSRFPDWALRWGLWLLKYLVLCLMVLCMVLQFFSWWG